MAALGKIFDVATFCPVPKADRIVVSRLLFTSHGSMQQIRWSWNNKMNPGSNPADCILAISLMVSGLLSGCASTPQHLTEENQNGIKNIAIISLVPESVNFDKIGLVSYSNEYTEFDMGSKLTDSVLAVTKERIAKSHPGWGVKSVEYDRTAILADVSTVYGFRAERANERCNYQ
jgi:hypothetical protein